MRLGEKMLRTITAQAAEHAEVDISSAFPCIGLSPVHDHR